MVLLHELADAGHTVILITHDRSVAAQARRVIEIRDGQIVGDSGRAVEFQAKSASSVGTAYTSSYQNSSISPRAVLWAELRDALRAAWRVMAVNRFRTALTLLGIVIGVASVIVMLAVGTGSQQKVMADMATFGAKAMYVSAMQGSSRDQAAPLTLADTDAIRQLPNIQTVAPYIEGRLVVRRGNIDHQTEVGGATTDLSEALSWPLAEGVWFDAADDLRLAKVAILGQSVRKVLFADGSNPLGQDILVEGVPFQVIGVLAAKGGGGGDEDVNERVVVPFASASARLYGHPHPGWISVLIRDMAQASATGDAILAALAQSRRAKDVRLWNQAESIRVQGETERTMALMLGLIAAISLVVGGIGVMNVMLMTVRERTREIGIRMATGARQRDILRQFLTEAVLVTVVGGAIGVLVGLALGGVLRVFGVPVVFSLTAIVGAFGCAVATGVIFGFMPAQRAAGLDPVVALASE